MENETKSVIRTMLITSSNIEINKNNSLSMKGTRQRIHQWSLMSSPSIKLMLLCKLLTEKIFNKFEYNIQHRF